MDVMSVGLVVAEPDVAEALDVEEAVGEVLGEV